MSDHGEQADEEPVQGQSAVTPTPSVSYTGEGNTRKVHPVVGRLMWAAGR